MRALEAYRGTAALPAQSATTEIRSAMDRPRRGERELAERHRFESATAPSVGTALFSASLRVSKSPGQLPFKIPFSGRILCFSLIIPFLSLSEGGLAFDHPPKNDLFSLG